MGWLSIVSNVFGMGSDYLKGRRELKKIKAEGAIQLEQAKTTAQIKRLSEDSDSAGRLDEIALQDVGWKDEYLMVIITIPTIMAFFPEYVPFVELGFEALEKMPEYYQYMLGGVYIYVFGFKRILLKVINAFMAKRGLI